MFSLLFFSKFLGGSAETKDAKLLEQDRRERMARAHFGVRWGLLGGCACRHVKYSDLPLLGILISLVLSNLGDSVVSRGFSAVLPVFFCVRRGFKFLVF